MAEVAIELFVQHGYDATTVDDIAIAAGVSKRSFFRYFPAKAEWHEQLYVSDRVLELVESSPALRARMVEKRDELRRQVSDALRERPGSTLDAFTADLLTAAAAAVLDVAAQEWLRVGGDRAELIRWGFEELSPGGRR